MDHVVDPGGRARPPRRARARGARGAAVVEYALGVALFSAVALGGIQALEAQSTDELNERADRSGAPDLDESAGGSTGGGSTGGSSGSDGTPAPTTEVFFSGFSNIKSTGNNPWTANVTAKVADAAAANVGGVRIEGQWTYLDGAVTKTVPAVCNQTNGSGSCQFQLGQIPPGVVEVTFTMIQITGGDPPVTYNGGSQTVVVHK